MAAFDQIRLSHLKKYLLCNLLILKWIKLAKQRKKRICWIRKIRSSRSQMHFNIGVLQNFENFTGKYLCWTLFFNKVAKVQCVFDKEEKVRRWCPILNICFIKLTKTATGGVLYKKLFLRISQYSPENTCVGNSF